ncbi:hypothetical protein [Bdellovibrio svalbardensis]|uniref:Uncharacterized protein n=1 Tax=Bdellovibrio svalbardensis TaxID=2972972 RepID=A0ABT6DHI5_9BACT|nr:hypothetical protein [Bdellovibrio svalbardensis]MDG0816314.1 hypothetical protein [Bdellovibrio svalbardensis]
MKNRNLLKALLITFASSLISVAAVANEIEDILKKKDEIEALVKYEKQEYCNVKITGESQNLSDRDIKLIATHLKSHHLQSNSDLQISYILDVAQHQKTIQTILSGEESQVETQVSVYRLKSHGLELVSSNTNRKNGPSEDLSNLKHRSLNAAMALVPTCWYLRHPDDNGFELVHPFGVHLPKSLCLVTDQGPRCINTEALN